MIVRAIPLKDFRTTALSTSQNGTAFNLGAALSSQKAYGALHLMEVSTGRTLVAKIQSATASGFAAPTDRFTFSLTSAVGSTWPTPLASLSTEHTWWRFTETLSTAASTAGSWKGLAWMGIEDNPLR